MKSTIFTLVLLGLVIRLYSQSNKFSAGIEYSPNFSNVTGYSNANEGFRIAHNVFLKAGYGFIKHVQVTTGIGYLNTREFDRVFLDGQLDIEIIESHRYHNYLVVPAGVKCTFGSFYINPEIGLGFNIGHPTRQTSYLSNGSVITQRYKETFDPTYTKVTIPAFLTIGNEIQLNSFSVLFGVKGYYSFNKISGSGIQTNNYYGFGVVTGVKF